MVSRPGNPIHFLLTIALIVAMPVCCCRGHLPGAAASASFSSDSGTACHGEMPGGHAGDLGADGFGGSGSPCGGGNSPPCQDDGPCDCGDQKDIKRLPEAPASVPVANSVLCVRLEPVTAVSSAIVVGGGLSGFSEAATRPPATLLRMHCALII